MNFKVNRFTCWWTVLLLLNRNGDAGILAYQVIGQIIKYIPGILTISMLKFYKINSDQSPV